MGDMTPWLGVVISALSLLVAAIALMKSERAQKEANAAQRRIVEIEEHRERDRQLVAQQARLRAELRKTAQHTTRLYIVNDGAVEARYVTVTLDGQPFSEHEAGGAALPSTIGPRSEISCILSTHTTCAPPFDIEITWEDDTGNDHTYRSTLTL